MIEHIAYILLTACPIIDRMHSDELIEIESRFRATWVNRRYMTAWRVTNASWELESMQGVGGVIHVGNRGDHFMVRFDAEHWDARYHIFGEGTVEDSSHQDLTICDGLRCVHTCDGSKRQYSWEHEVYDEDVPARLEGFRKTHFITGVGDDTLDGERLRIIEFTTRDPSCTEDPKRRLYVRSDGLLAREQIVDEDDNVRFATIYKEFEFPVSFHPDLFTSGVLEADGTHSEGPVSPSQTALTQLPGCP